VDNILTLALEKGGIIAFLIAVIIILWYQLTKRSVPKESFNHLLKRFDDLDDDIVKGIIPSIEKLYESQKNTQNTLSELRRSQELQGWVFQRQLTNGANKITPEELFQLIEGLDNSTREQLLKKLKRLSQGKKR
jgi:hypothetical protein